MSPPVQRVLLYIDDRPHLLQFRETLLRRQGYIVITATSVAAAMAKLETCWIDAVLLEYKSEGMDAEAVAFQIKKRFPNQPVVLLSAYSCTPERLLWLVDEYVVKSEPHQTIERAIRSREKDGPLPERLPVVENLDDLSEDRWDECPLGSGCKIRLLIEGVVIAVVITSRFMKRG